MKLLAAVLAALVSQKLADHGVCDERSSDDVCDERPSEALELPGFHWHEKKLRNEAVPSLVDSLAFGHSLFLVDDIVSAVEREILMSAATDAAARHSRTKTSNKKSSLKLNVALQLRSDAGALGLVIIRRVLNYIERTWPSLALRLFGQTKDLGSMHVECKVVHEPAVIVYSPGGKFDIHEDGHDLTVLVPLTPEDSFSGGGTAFYPDTKVDLGGNDFTAPVACARFDPPAAQPMSSYTHR